MSNFEDYNSVSNHYDEGRVPAGAKMYASVIQSYLDKPLAEVSFFAVIWLFVQLGLGKGWTKTNRNLLFVLCK